MKRENSYQFQGGLDGIDWQILKELQADARLSYSALGRKIGLSQPATAERVKRLEEEGVITGYHAQVDPVKVGRPIKAFVRLRLTSFWEAQLARKIDEIKEVMECHRVTGEDSLILKIYLSSIGDLEGVIDKLSKFGDPATSLVLSSIVDRFEFDHE